MRKTKNKIRKFQATVTWMCADNSHVHNPGEGARGTCLIGHVGGLEFSDYKELPHPLTDSELLDKIIDLDNSTGLFSEFGHAVSRLLEEQRGAKL